MLFAAAEESRSWELVADVSGRGVFDPGEVNRAHELLLRFVARGWIEAYRASTTNPAGGTLSDKELTGVLADAAAWRYGQGADPDLWIRTTEAGDRVLFEHWRRRPLHTVGFQ